MTNGLRSKCKLLGTLPLLVSYIVISGALIALTSSRRKRHLLVRNTSVFARVILRLLGIHIHVKHPERLHLSGGGLLIVANHLSYVDVLAVSSLIPAVFITSVEMRQTLLLGTLARFGGSIFVERRNIAGLRKEIESIAQALNQGLCVVLFPEGTTSNGQQMRPFKNSLFDAAIKAKKDIFPFCLRYTKVNDRHMTCDDRDSVFYYGDMTFFGHLSRLLALRSVDLEVHPLETIRVDPQDSRKELSARAYSVISEVYYG